MRVLVVGATGGTGGLLVEQLLERGLEVRAVVRAPERLPSGLSAAEQLHVVTASLLDLSDAELADLVGGCGAVASCLGHNLTWQGVYGPPRQLVTQAVRRLCAAVSAHRPESPVRFVLMNTAGNRNRDLAERISLAERGVMGLVRLLLPPHADNEGAAEVLRTTAHASLEWAVVRPDTLTNDPEVTAYEVYPSPRRSALFNPGKTSRINVAHFMADLITDDGVWGRWRGQMPVIYNQQPAAAIT